jgi:uncharacterized LabA/DUF88 family protein
MLKDEYLEELNSKLKVPHNKIQEWLLNSSIYISKYLTDYRKMLKQYKKKKKEYTDMYYEKYSYYRFKYKWETNNTDADRMAKNDPEVTTKNNEVEEIKDDIDLLQSLIDELKQKYWKIKAYQDYEQYLQGK